MKKIKALKDFKTFPTWFVSLTHPKVFVEMISYLRTVSRDFFLIQFLRKFKFDRTPIVSVDNRLDKTIPFNTRKISDYLGFVNFWIRPLGLLVQTLGIKKSAPHLVEFYYCIKKAYKSAAAIYRFRFSTTDRPHYKKRIYFAGVHMLDPHLLCVPSLHITVVALTYSFMRKTFASENYSQEEKDAWLLELYDGAVNISETVLYVKQHSVNCIPAALYMTEKIFPSFFFKEDALAILDSMFQKSADIPEGGKEEVRSYMKNLFLRFDEEGAASGDWKEPLKKWLIKYEKSADNS